MKIRGLLYWLLTLHSFPAFSADNTGPRLIRARVDEREATNYILLELSEPVVSATARNTNNYAITLFGTTNRVPVTSAFFVPGAPPTIPPFIRMRVATNYWHLGGVSNYFVTVNNLQDPASNNIAPNSRVGISWPRHLEVLSPHDVWHYQTSPFTEPDLLDQPWTSCDFQESRSWQEASGPFECDWLGNCINGPALFRTSFNCPPEFATEGRLRLEWQVEASAVFHLNGQEFYRLNLPSPPTQLNSGVPTCVSFFAAPLMHGGGEFVFTNLVAGTNCLAVAVLTDYCLPVSLDASFGPGSIRFGLSLTAIRYIAGPVPAEDPPALAARRLPGNRVQLAWDGSGNALEVTTNLPPAGQWVEVPDMANPYTVVIEPNSPRFFRLRK